LFEIAFSGVLPRGEFKNTHRVEKFLQKNRPKTQNRFFLDCFLSRFLGVFSVRGFQKHDKKIIGETNRTPSLFRTLTHPPTTGPPTFVLPAPRLSHSGGISVLCCALPKTENRRCASQAAALLLINK
jgi:hypothetical protein